MSDQPLEFGVNLNNRAPLLTEEYGVRDLVDLGALAEDSGFDSLWLGDSLLARPRHDPLVLMAALSQRTSTVRLGHDTTVPSSNGSPNTGSIRHVAPSSSTGNDACPRRPTRTPRR